MLTKVSVIIPAYNAGKYINQTVNSVLRQSYPDVECIVVNDGSTDDTHQQLITYGDEIVYIRQENRGRAVTRNRGIASATGEYIALLDADDYWKADKLSRQIALIETDDTIGAVGCGAELVNEQGNFVRELKSAFTLLPTGNKGFEFLITQGCGIPAPLTTLVVRRECLDAIGCFDESINTMEEWDLLLRMISNWSIGCVPESLAFYRGYGMHIPSKVAPRQRQEKYIQVVEQAFTRRVDMMAYADLRGKALGLAYLRGGFIDYAVNDYEEGARRLQKAYGQDPQLFQGQTAQFFDFLAYFASYLYDTVTPLEEAILFTGSVFDNLPARLRFLGESERTTKGQVCLIQAFDCYGRRDLECVRIAASHTLANDLAFIKNYGLLLILTESLVGSRLTNLLRLPVRFLVSTFGDGREIGDYS